MIHLGWEWDNPLRMDTPNPIPTLPAPSHHRPIPVSPLTILFLLAGCPWDVPGMSPVLLRPRNSTQSLRNQRFLRNGAVPARAFSPPFPAGSGSAPAPTGGARISESPHPEFGGLSPGPLVPMSPLCPAATLNPRQFRGWSLQDPLGPGCPWSLPGSRSPSRAGIRCRICACHPVSATSCSAGLGTRSGHPGQRCPHPGPRGTPRTHRLRSDFATS